MNFRFLISPFLLLALASCVKDTPAPSNPNPVIPLSSGNKVFVINEGNFNSGNADITLYDSGIHTSIENYFFYQNNTALGDVAQSMNKINNDFYIVVNNSNKIVVCGSDLKIKHTISGLTSPRYIIAVSNSKAYVSDLYANGLSIVDLNTGTKTGSISCPGKTEKMVMLYNKVYVTNTDKDKVYVIDASNNILIDSIAVGINASSLILDKNDKLWVLSSGTSSVQGKMSLIDPVNNSITWTQNFQSGEKADYLCCNGTKDTLYYTNKDGICRMPVVATALPNAFIASTSNIYGLGVHPITHDIYIADAIDYVSKSKIYIYSSNGVIRSNFRAGINANGFYFD